MATMHSSVLSGKENGMNIFKSINEGPFQMGMFRETLAEEKDRYNADIWATNILLQGLPKYIYTLINHYTDAKDIWDNVKMLMEENGVNILKSIDEGPFQMGMFLETLAEGKEGSFHLSPERPRVYSDLSPEENDRYNADIQAANILLQGLPKDIYTLINHYTNAKDIWDNVKMLLEGLELTKEDRKSQLYDDFEHFGQHKRETIHDYYVRFAKLINDMQNVKMTMSIMQLNSKFVNNMLPEWGRFVTAMKLNRGLRDSSYE
nr:putative zinc finger, CCHC-type [Tanacetum cinerariifolium]